MSVPNVVLAFQKIAAGRIVEAIIGVFTDIMGAWFWVSLIGLGITMTYLKTRNFVSTVTVGVILSPTVIPLFPSVLHYIIFMGVTLGLTVLVYKVFKGHSYG